MAAQDTQLYKDTAEILRLYNTDANFKTRFNSSLNNPYFTPSGRSVKTYVHVIASFSREYKDYIYKPLNERNISDLFSTAYTKDSQFIYRKLQDAIMTSGSSIYRDVKDKKDIEKLEKMREIDSRIQTPQEKDQALSELFRRIDESYKKEQVKKSEEAEGTFKKQEELQSEDRQTTIEEKAQETLQKATQAASSASQSNIAKEAVFRAEMGINKIYRKIPIGTVAGAVLGAVTGSFLFEPAGYFIGGLLGGLVGYKVSYSLSGDRNAIDFNSQQTTEEDSIQQVYNEEEEINRQPTGFNPISLLLFLSPSPIKKSKIIFWIIAAVVVLLIVLIYAFFLKPLSLMQLYQSNVCAGDITQCLFYGQNGQGIKIGNPAFATYITEVATKVGIPASVLAAIARVENAQHFADPNPDFFNNDYSWDWSGSTVVGCCYGMMQFNTGTFATVFINNRGQLESLFGKIKMENNASITQEQYNDPNGPYSREKTMDTLRIYSVRDSVIAAAFLVKNTKEAYNGDGPWDRGAIDKIISVYYGACQDFYCDDVWRSYSQCLASTAKIAPDGVHACPLCGTWVNSQTPGPGQYWYYCGHHADSPNHNAIDIYDQQPQGGSPVFAVVSGVVKNINDGSGNPSLWLEGDDGFNYLYLHLIPSSQVVQLGESPKRVDLGQQIARIAKAGDASNNGIAHLHISAGTKGNPQCCGNPPDVPMGPLLDTWCGNNTCGGNPGH